MLHWLRRLTRDCWRDYRYYRHDQYMSSSWPGWRAIARGDD